MSSTDSNTSDEKQRILIVDDDENLGRLISQYLTDHGFKVSVEHSGAQATDRWTAAVARGGPRRHSLPT